MIHYRCKKCKIKLETEDSFSGQLDTCPGCGEVNLAPLSKEDKTQVKKERRAKKREEFNQHVALLSEVGKVQPAFGKMIKDGLPLLLKWIITRVDDGSRLENSPLFYNCVEAKAFIDENIKEMLRPLWIPLEISYALNQFAKRLAKQIPGIKIFLEGDITDDHEEYLLIASLVVVCAKKEEIVIETVFLADNEDSINDLMEVSRAVLPLSTYSGGRGVGLNTLGTPYATNINSNFGVVDYYNVNFQTVQSEQTEQAEPSIHWFWCFLGAFIFCFWIVAAVEGC